ncbi:MAG: energy transducer TonB [Acidobacteria bacterium]|nr:energy transducer TonB [Acidobacteriota bacterium]
MQRVGQRQGFLVSAVIHLTLLMILLAQPPSTRDQDDLDLSELERRDVVFLPPSEVLRQLVPAPRPTPVPTPPPQTPDPTKKDRISIGPPSELQSKGPLILRREDDLTQVPKGQPSRPPQQAPTPAPNPTPAPRIAQRGDDVAETAGRQGLRLPSGLLGPPVPQGDEGSRRGSGAIGSSVNKAVDEVTRRMAQNAPLGLPDGTGQNLYGLRFDPRGADFTLWVNDFKNQVYRNWIVPQAAYLGYGGHVDFEFTVERDGSISALRMLKSSGTDSLDRAARNSLTSSRFEPLPDDYGPPRITMQVAFHYGPDRNS